MSATLIPFALTTDGTGVLQHVAVSGGDLRFSAEGHKSFGGTDSAPSPLDLALGALTSCTQVTSFIVASQRNATLGAWKIDLKAHFDAEVLATGAQGVSNFRDVHLTIEVETDLSGKDFEAFSADVERRCPVTQLFRGSGVAFSADWTAKPLAAGETARKVA